MRRRTALAIFLSVPAAALAPSVADACGGLIGENGTIQLVRTTTLAAYHDGVERYVTSFEFTGEGESVGSIVPLPDVPTSVERGGDWTLQRLALEVAPPPPPSDDAAEATAAASAEVQIILETQIDALDITVLSGGGDEVGQWALENGFFLPPDAPEVLDFYASRSPVFMAAKFDAQRARDLGQGAGDSTPIMATIPTDDPWVPVRILGLGLDAEQRIEADVFLLTDREPELLAGGPGLSRAAQRGWHRACCSPTCARTSAWSGCRTRCGSPTSSSTPRLPTSTTTSQCRSTRQTSRRSPTPASVLRPSCRFALPLTARHGGRSRPGSPLEPGGLDRLDRDRPPPPAGHAGGAVKRLVPVVAALVVGAAVALGGLALAAA